MMAMSHQKKNISIKRNYKQQQQKLSGTSAVEKYSN